MKRGGIVVALWLLGASGHADPAAFEACRDALRESPQDRRAISCFYRAARQDGSWDEAAVHLSELGRRLDAAGEGRLAAWALFNLGRVRLDQGSDAAAELFDRAAAAFASTGDQEGEFYSWINLFVIEQRHGRFAAAEERLARAERLAIAAGRADWLSQSRIQQARFLRRRGVDLARAERLLLEVRPKIFPSDPYPSRRDWLMELASVRYDLGALEDARRSYLALRELAEEAGDAYTRASALVGLAAVLHELPAHERDGEVGTVVDEALEVARASGNRQAEALSLMHLGRLVDGDEGTTHLEACRALASELGWTALEAQCLAQLARQALAHDPEAARQRLDDALRLAARSSEPWDALHFWEPHLDVLWATAPRQRALADSLLLLDAVEVMREQQASGHGQAGILVSWADVYDGLIGRLLNGGGGEAGAALDRGTVETAFALRERFHGRLLLDELRRSDAYPERPPADPLARRRSELLDRIGQVQRRLLASPAEDENRQRLLSELAALERREADLEDDMALPGFTSRRPDFVTLDALQAGLDERQAVLAFQLGSWKKPYRESAGGSWVFAITRDEVRVHRLPDPSAVEPLLEIFLGLIDDPRSPQAASELYRQWFAPALEALPPAVDRLIVLGDRALHRVPLALLRPAATSPPLAARFEITLAPSATLWHRWRGQGDGEGGERAFERPALILADPELPVPSALASSGTGAATRGALLAAGRLPPLPHARDEGRRIRRRLGSRSTLWIGEEASERALAEADLGRYAVVHLAAHAVVDALHPRRSAVVLAAGDRRRDGLLQPREIAGLELYGRLVVLAACQGAAGRALRGEGVLSLARSFFAAGTRTVVGSLWPLRDDEAAVFFDRFYAHLSRGLSVAAALRGGQQDLIDGGHPDSAWAGFVVLGDGSFIPLPREPGWPTWPVLALLSALVVGWLGWRARRRSRPGFKGQDL